MDKKLKFNAFLKGVSIFAFVAFCLLAIFAGVTLPFVSNASTADGAVVNAESGLHDCAVASAESDAFNPLDFCITLGECNTNDTYYGFYISNFLWSYIKQYDYSQTSGLLSLFSLIFSGNSTKFYVIAGKTDSVAYLALSDMNYIIKYFEDYFNYSCFCPYIVFPKGFKMSDILSDAPSDSLFSSNFNVFTSVPYGYKTEIVSNYGFESRFGNFVGLASSDFYINLAVEPIIPEKLRQVTSTVGQFINNWHVQGQSTFQNIYYLSLFDRYYLNGTQYFGYVNCGWVLNSKTSPEVSSDITFNVLGTPIWQADCDFNTDGNGSISNIRNGKFLVASNFVSDFNVYKVSSADDSMYIMNSVYKDIDYSDFLDSFIAQQDFNNVKVPSDNALYLKGYQSATDEYYNNGFNVGLKVGEKSGYNTGFTAGESKGYKRGIEDGNTYSFLSLFGAVFDAPIQALFGGTQTLPAGTQITDKNGNIITLDSATKINRGGMLNFDLMGVNLSGFVLALFSMSIIVIVIKFALAKK